MLKKCLIALLLVAISSAPAFSHEMWDYGVTTSVSWEWQPKIVGPIDVCMKVVMWADLYWDGCLMLHQVDGDVFAGCIVAKLCVNFTSINVKVKYTPLKDITNAKDNKGYWIDISRKPDGQDCAPTFSGDGKVDPSDSIQIDDGPYLAGDNLLLCICMKVVQVEPQALAYQALTPEKVGEIWATLTPTIAPPGQPANGIIATSDATTIMGGSLIP